MANPEHVELLLKYQGEMIGKWNTWRKENPYITPVLEGADLREVYLRGADLRRANLRGTDLQGANLRGSDLQGANLIGTDLRGADLQGAYFTGSTLAGAYLMEVNLTKLTLTEANLRGANLWGANLRGADLRGANLWGANLCGADLTEANLWEANLRGADLTETKLRGADLRDANLIEANLIGTDLRGANLGGANLRGQNLNRKDLSGLDLRKANLTQANLVGTNLKNAYLDGAAIYGVSAWDVELDGASQLDLIVTRPGEAVVTVDNLKVAQFIYLLLNNAEIRQVIETMTSRVVLILGCFTLERKTILDVFQAWLRKYNYSPILVDFEKPASRDLTEILRNLAHLARFIIADLTEPSSIAQELQAIIPDLQVPVQPVLLEAKRESTMFVDFKKYPWVLPICFYQDQANLLEQLPEIIKLAEALAKEYSGGNKDT